MRDERARYARIGNDELDRKVQWQNNLNDIADDINRSEATGETMHTISVTVKYSEALKKLT